MSPSGPAPPSVLQRSAHGRASGDGATHSFNGHKSSPTAFLQRLLSIPLPLLGGGGGAQSRVPDRRRDRRAAVKAKVSRVPAGGI